MPNGYLYDKSSTIKVPASLKNSEWKDCKSQGIMKFALRLCLLEISEATPIKPTIEIV